MVLFNKRSGTMLPSPNRQRWKSCPDMPEPDTTPLMRQYREIKAQHQEAILFFRVGDFYEMFFEDAEEAAQLLDIVLTSRGKNKDIPIPLCGVPYHAATGYIAKLLKAGKTVALCEQVEDPKSAKGLVRREVVRLYTPGTLFDGELLPSNESNFIVAISYPPSHTSSHSHDEMAWGLATLEMSTGEFWILEYPYSDQHSSLADELGRLEPRELIHPSHHSPEMMEVLKYFPQCRRVQQETSSFDLQANRHLLTNHFQVHNTEELGIPTLTRGLEAAGALLRYIQSTQPTINHHHIHRPRLRISRREMNLDAVTIRNLELIRSFTQHQDGPTLYKHSMLPALP